MADFNRLLIPHSASWPTFPAGLDSWGLSGKGHFRTTMQVGRSWEEEYPKIKWDNPNHRAFLAYVNSLFRERTIFEIQHYHLQTPLGTITGNPTVASGAAQTGSTINTSALTGPGGTNALLQGDIIKFANLTLVYDVTANVAVGATAIPISPPIFTGGSPTASSTITCVGNVRFRCVIVELTMPEAGSNTFYSGLKIKFRECP